MASSIAEKISFAFDRSISPRTVTMQRVPRCSVSTPANPLTVCPRADSPAHPHRGATVSPHDLDRVHEALHELEATTPVRAAGDGQTPRALVADGDLGVAADHIEPELEVPLLRPVRVLDGVRTRLAARHEDGVGVLGVGVELSQPPTKRLAERREHPGLRD